MTHLSSVASVKGTRDFYPEDLRLRNWLFSKFHETSQVFGFQEFETPVVETDQLFILKSGPEIVDQMYVFENKQDPDEKTTDKSTKQKLVMRPEMTPSLARMILQRGKSLIMPLKWYNVAQCWRYETCAIGRRREFFQWNLDLIGIDNYRGELELLSALVDFFTRVGLTSKEIVIKISDRRILLALLDQFLNTNSNLPKRAEFTDIFRCLDKRDKVANPTEMLMETANLTAEEADRVLHLSQLNYKDCRSYVNIPQDVEQNFSNLMAKAEILGLLPWLEFDLTVVRGLDYYTGIVFEVFDRRKKFRAICGGGRYDRLLEAYDPKISVPACGFGFGDCVIMEVLKSFNKLPQAEQLKFRVDFLVISFNEELEAPALQITQTLRSSGKSAHYLFESNKKLKWYYSYADREGVHYVILVGPDEFAKGLVSLKNLETGEQTQIPISEVSSVV